MKSIGGGYDSVSGSSTFVGMRDSQPNTEVGSLSNTTPTDVGDFPLYNSSVGAFEGNGSRVMNRTVEVGNASLYDSVVGGLGKGTSRFESLRREGSGSSASGSLPVSTPRC